MRRHVRLIGLLSLFALVLAACSGGSSTPDATDTAAPPASPDMEATGALKTIMDNGVLRVSTDPAYPPQSELNVKTGEYEGFDIDVANEIAKRLGVRTEWETPKWGLIIAGSWNDRWDASVGSMTVTPEREEVLDFSPPYYYTPAVVVVNEDSTVTDPTSELDGKPIGVCGGCTYDFYLQKSLEIPGETIDFQIDDATIKSYDTDSTAIQDLTLGRVDAVITSATTAQAAVDAGKGVKVVGEPLFYEPLAVAFDKNSTEDNAELVAKVSSIVEEMHADGTLSAFSNKWFGQDLTVKVTS